MIESTPTDDVDAGEAAMRGLIHTVGFAKAAVAAADMYAAPANLEDRDMLAGMFLAAYRAGQLDGLNQIARVS